MKTALRLLFLVAVVWMTPVATGFTVSPLSAGRSCSISSLHMTKKFPAGRPYTGQADEDMAMWFDEDKQGNRKKALKKPVGGRPVDLFTKEDVEAIEKKGVDPLERFKRKMEWLAKRPQRGY